METKKKVSAKDVPIHTSKSELTNNPSPISRRLKFASDIVELLVKEALNELQDSKAESIEYALALLSDARKYTQLSHHGHAYPVSEIMEIGTMLKNWRY